jgi:hypothetical protein
LRAMPNISRCLSLSAICLLAIAACGAPAGTPSARTPGASPTTAVTPSPTTGAISHPTEPDAVVLRMEQVGGFVPMEYNAVRLPQFTLYGDGTVIYQGPPPPFDPGAHREPLRKATMTEEQIQALLAYALGRGGLLDARAHYPHPLVADAPSTVFSINAGGADKKVTIDALEEGEPTAPDDVAERRRFGQLMTTLSTFGEAVVSGEAVAAGEYEPVAYRAAVVEAAGAQGEMRDWPWQDLSPDDFLADQQGGFRTADLTPEQARALADDPRGGVLAVIVTGPDRAPYTISMRPLLPDEVE